MKLLQADIPTALHRHLRVEAAKRDKTIRDLLIEAIEAHIGTPADQEDAS